MKWMNLWVRVQLEPVSGVLCQSSFLLLAPRWRQQPPYLLHRLTPNTHTPASPIASRVFRFTAMAALQCAVRVCCVWTRGLPRRRGYCPPRRRPKTRELDCREIYAPRDQRKHFITSGAVAVVTHQPPHTGRPTSLPVRRQAAGKTPASEPASRVSWSGLWGPSRNNPLSFYGSDEMTFLK